MAAAIDADGLTCHKRCQRRSEEEHGICDILDRAPSAQQCCTQHALYNALKMRSGQPLCVLPSVDLADTDGIDADSIAPLSAGNPLYQSLD